MKQTKLPIVHKGTIYKNIVSTNMLQKNASIWRNIFTIVLEILFFSEPRLDDAELEFPTNDPPALLLSFPFGNDLCHQLLYFTEYHFVSNNSYVNNNKNITHL